MQTIPSTTSTRGLIVKVALAGVLSLVLMGATASLADARKMSTTYTTFLGPATATKPVGVNHTLTATVFRHTENCDPGGPLAQAEPATGAQVKFEVTSGPNKGKSGVGTTNAQGQATFTYTSSKVGTDKLVATPIGLKNVGICNADPGPALPSQTVDAIWVEAKGDDPPAEDPCGERAPQIKVDDVRVREGNTDLAPATPAAFTVSLNVASPLPVTVEYAAADGSAIAPDDYVAQTGKLTFKPGDLTQKVTIDVRGDRDPETDESFRVDLSNPSNATLADPLGIGTIIDDDALYAP